MLSTLKQNPDLSTPELYQQLMPVVIGNLPSLRVEQIVDIFIMYLTHHSSCEQEHLEILKFDIYRRAHLCDPLQHLLQCLALIKDNQITSANHTLPAQDLVLRLGQVLSTLFGKNALTY